MTQMTPYVMRLDFYFMILVTFQKLHINQLSTEKKKTYNRGEGLQFIDKLQNQK